MKETGTRKKLFSWLLATAVLVFLALHITGNIREILTYSFQLNWWLLAGSFAAALSGLLVMFAGWGKLCRCYGLDTDTAENARVYFVSQLGKYVPGKVGLLLVRVQAFSSHSRKKVAMATAVEYVTSFLSACIVLLVSMGTARDVFPEYLKWSALSLLVLLLVLIWPSVFRRWSCFLFRLMKKEPPGNFPTFKDTLQLVGIYSLTGILYGLSFFLSINALAPLELTYLPAVSGVFWAAALVGIAAVFAPGGIGVREGVIMMVLPAFVAEPVVIISAVLVRLIMVSAELFAAGASSLLARARKQRRQVQSSL